MAFFKLFRDFSIFSLARPPQPPREIGDPPLPSAGLSSRGWTSGDESPFRALKSHLLFDNSSSESKHNRLCYPLIWKFLSPLCRVGTQELELPPGIDNLEAKIRSTRAILKVGKFRSRGTSSCHPKVLTNKSSVVLNCYSVTSQPNLWNMEEAFESRQRDLRSEATWVLHFFLDII
jgi:hypothetical protein